MASNGKHAERFWPVTLACLSGPLLWSLHLATVYGLHHVGCLAWQTDADRMRIIVAVTTAVFVLLLGGIFAGVRRFFERLGAPESTRLRSTFVYLARFMLILSAFGVVLAGAAAGFDFGCTPLR